MKIQICIDNEEERIIVHVHSRTELVNKIEEMVLNEENKIEGINCFGYLESDIVPLKIKEITMFCVEDDKTYASFGNRKYSIKKRLYQIEEILNDDFIKINKSCIINKNHIKKFNTSWNGALLVELDNDERQYVSRRMIKNLKERMGL